MSLHVVSHAREMLICKLLFLCEWQPPLIDALIDYSIVKFLLRLIWYVRRLRKPVKLTLGCLVKLH